VSLEKVPDYLRIVKQPIDLKTIEEKLSRNQYRDIEDFYRDIDKIFQNCRIYNKNSSIYYKCST
jgi:hypothetical protein